MPRPSVATTTLAKPSAAAKLPERVTTILHALLDPSDAVHFADVLPRQGRVAELAPRGHVRVVRRQALVEIALGEQVEVGVDFQPSVVIEPPALQREQKPRDARAERGPHVSPAPHRVLFRVRLTFGHRI